MKQLVHIGQKQYQKFVNDMNDIQKNSFNEPVTKKQASPFQS